MSFLCRRPSVVSWTKSVAYSNPGFRTCFTRCIAFGRVLLIKLGLGIRRTRLSSVNPTEFDAEVWGWAPQNQLVLLSVFAFLSALVGHNILFFLNILCLSRTRVVHIIIFHFHHRNSPHCEICICFWWMIRLDNCGILHQWPHHIACFCTLVYPPWS